MRYTQICALSLRAVAYCCALTCAWYSCGAREAHAIAYARVDLDVNGVLISGTSGTSITAGTGTEVFSGENSALIQTAFQTLTAGSGVVTGFATAAPQAFLGDVGGDQGENNIFLNTNPAINTANFSRADNRYHVTTPGNTYTSGGINMDAVAEASIGVPLAPLETNVGKSVITWSFENFATTDPGGGTRDINVTFSWTRRDKLFIDLGFNPPSVAKVFLDAGVTLIEHRGANFPGFASAPGSAIGLLDDTPAFHFPGTIPIDQSTGPITFTHTFSVTPGVGATGLYTIFGTFTLESTVVLAIPEPSGLLLVSLGMVGLIARTRRRRRGGCV